MKGSPAHSRHFMTASEATAGAGEGGRHRASVARKKPVWPGRDPAPKAEGKLAWQRPLCGPNHTHTVSQRQPLACELTVDAVHGRNDMQTHICVQ